MPIPLMSSPSIVTLSVAAALMTIAFVPLTRAPAVGPRPRMVIDFVIVTPPNPPGSITLISPPAAVFEIDPAKVLHGAVRLHGFASSPTPDTQVRVACPNADEGRARTTRTRAGKRMETRVGRDMKRPYTESRPLCWF